MQTRITPEEMVAAARQLARSERGRARLKQLLQWLEAGPIDLDFLDQRAFLALLGGAWSGHADAARAAIKDAIGAQSPDSRGGATEKS